MKKMTLQKSLFTAIFTVLLILIAAALCFGGPGSKTVSAAQEENRFAISPYPGEYFDVRGDLPSSDPFYGWNFHGAFEDHDLLGPDGHDISLRVDASGLFCSTITLSDYGDPERFRDYITFIRHLDGTIYYNSVRMGAILNYPEGMDWTGVYNARDSLWAGTYGTYIYNYHDRVPPEGIYDIFSVLILSGTGQHVDTYHAFESSAFRFYYGPAQPMPPAPEKEGHTFTGWYLDAACTINAAAYLIEQDTELFAGWAINQYDIAFDMAGATDRAGVSLNYNTPLSVNIGAAPTRYGYNFIGWQLNDQLIDANTRLPARNITLKALWEQVIWTVTFIVDGKVYKTESVPHGTALNNLAGNPALAQYSVQAVVYPSGEPPEYAAPGESFAIEADAVIYIEPKTGVDAGIGWAAAHWQTLVGGGVLVVLLIAILLLAGGKKRKKSKVRF